MAMKYLHTMVRVTDVQKSLDFYCGKLGMIEVRRVDNEAGRFTLRLQPKEMRDAQAMDLRNLAVAIVAEEILRLDRKLRTFMPVWDLVALLIGQGLFQDPIPPDELHLIMARYSTLRYHQGQGYALPDTYNSFNLRGAPDERARAHNENII